MLGEDECIDIIEHSIPSKWQQQMLLQGWDPVVHSLQELQEFCEQIELVKNMETTTGAKPPTTTTIATVAMPTETTTMETTISRGTRGQDP